MVLHNYEYFVAIVDEGSLTKAAEHLYVSQPSLSQYLKRLEANLGVELFDRSASPLRLMCFQPSTSSIRTFTSN